MTYDVAIIGGGPAGLTAGIYAVRAGLSTVLFEMAFCGGQAVNSHNIENYPGFTDGVSGSDLGIALEQQAERLGVQILRSEVKSVELSGENKKIATRKQQFDAKTIVIATGTKPRGLGVLGESELVGMGVSYCATCDGGFYKNKVTAVIGGGDTALGDAAYLARIARKVYIIHRRGEFRAAKLTIDSALKNENVEPIYNCIVERFIGDAKLEKLALKDTVSGESSELEVDGAFLAVGSTPQTQLFEGQIELVNGYIATNVKCETKIPGVYAAGDIRHDTLRQVVTAAADGANAANQAAEYIASKNI